MPHAFYTPRPVLRRHARRGFTLIEIILVVVIIATLAALVGPRIVGQGQKARVRTTTIQMASIKTALTSFEIYAGRFPTTSEGLEALIRKPSNLDDSQWPDKYMDTLPKDAWQQKFQYTCPSEHDMDFDLVSAGPDRQFGSDDDITNYVDEDDDE